MKLVEAVKSLYSARRSRRKNASFLPAVAAAGAATLVLGSVWAAPSGFTFAPTTTLALETGNNTSAADSWRQKNLGENASAGNVSKVPVRSLLYAGASTRIYAHLMPWFGRPDHMDVGYTSSDPAQVKRQVSDMLSRGIQGVVIDWYGPGPNLENDTALAFIREAESRGNFEVAIMEDKGALNATASAGGDVAGRLIADLDYVHATYESSPAYMRANGRPLVFEFGLEALSIDWGRVRNAASGNPIFIWENADGWSRPESGGAFAWIDPLHASIGYLDDYYGRVASAPASAIIFGTAYKGFDDRLAAWTANRVMDQRNAQTWLETFAKIDSTYSASRQLGFLQLVTWNDYEEGTELESGIENGVSVSPSLSGSTLGWSIAGDESTLDHFTVFISTDGSQLMPLADVPASSRSYDLAPFGLGAVGYSLFVKAVGKPCIVNKMSAAVAWSSGSPPPPPPPPPPSSIAIHVAEPTAGATSSGPLHVVADATSSYPISAVFVYVDDQLAYQTAASAVDTSIALGLGAHKVVVQTWDSTGALAKSPDIWVTIASPLAVSVASPRDGADVGSPVHVVGSASSASPIDAIKIYVDDQDVFTVHAASVDTLLPLAPGSHRIVVQAWDTTGAVAKGPVTVNVAAPGPLAVHVAQPANGATLGSPVRVVADATSSHPVSAIIVYVDDQEANRTYSSALDTKLPLAPGPHRIVVQAWDSTGAYVKGPVSVTVP